MPLSPIWLSRAKAVVTAASGLIVLAWIIWLRRRLLGQRVLRQEAIAAAGSAHESASVGNPDEAKGEEQDQAGPDTAEGTPRVQDGAALTFMWSGSTVQTTALSDILPPEELGCRMRPGSRAVHMVPRRTSTGAASHPNQPVPRRTSTGAPSHLSEPAVPCLQLEKASPDASVGAGSPPTKEALPSARRASLGPSSDLTDFRNVRRRSMRRLSRQFLSYCMCDDDDDFWSIPSTNSETFSTPPSSASFNLGSSDSEGEGGRRYRIDTQAATDDLTLEEMFSFDLERIDTHDGLELEDLFSFDLDKIAAALRRGDGLEQLQEVIEESMSANLELRTANPGLPSLADAEPSPLMAGDLSGRMTPEQTTPNKSPKMADLAEQREGLTKRLSATPTPTRRRRSSTVQSTLSAAVDAACVRNRKSLANAAAQEYRAQVESASKKVNTEKLSATVQDCVIKAHKQRRHSLIQAAEVVELASLREESGMCEEWGAEDLSAQQLTTQLQLVQQAIERARKHHRQSIAKALHSSPKEAVQSA